MNIFNIEEELQSIYNEIEDNDGVLTEELEEKLILTEESFRNKAKSYTNVIKLINVDIDACDCEIKRLQAIKKNKQKLVEKLSKILVEAIDKFGDCDKRGVKFLDYGTGKISIYRSISVNVDEEQQEFIITRLVRRFDFASSCNDSEIVGGIEDLLNSINYDIVKENDCPFKRRDFSNCSEEDLKNLMVDFTSHLSIEDIIKNKDKTLYELLTGFFNTKIVPATSKTELKSYLNSDDANLSYASISENKSLNIK